MLFKSLSAALLGASLIALTACSGGTETPSEVPKKEAMKAPATLADILAHPRRAENMARDKFRNPKETLEFLSTNMLAQKVTAPLKLVNLAVTMLLF